MDVTDSRSLGQWCPRECFKYRYPISADKGFTLIELLAALAIASILFGIGLPGVSSVMATNRLTSQINLLSGAVAYTRSVAIQNNQAAIICKSSNGTECNVKAKWEDGWLIYVDKDDDRVLDTDKGDMVLRIQAPLIATTLRYKAFGPRGYIAYQPDGFTQTNGTFTLCSKGKPELKKALILSKTGRLRVSNTGYANKPLKCP